MDAATYNQNSPLTEAINAECSRLNWETGGVVDVCRRSPYSIFYQVVVEVWNGDYWEDREITVRVK